MERKGKQRAKEYKKMTPAVAAGLMDRRGSVKVPVYARDGADLLSAAISGGRLNKCVGKSSVFGLTPPRFPVSQRNLK